MKDGLKAGQTSRIEIEVADHMVATFEGKTVHELYSTSSLVHHMEYAARQLILPYLENHEEGMGSYVEVSHLAPTIPGMKVTIEATLKEIKDNKVVAEVVATNVRGRIARGSVTQAIVDRQWLDRKKKELAVLNNLVEDSETKIKNPVS